MIYDNAYITEFFIKQKSFINSSKKEYSWAFDNSDACFAITLLHRLGYEITLDNHGYIWNFQIWKSGYQVGEGMGHDSISNAVYHAICELITRIEK